MSQGQLSQLLNQKIGRYLDFLIWVKKIQCSNISKKKTWLYGDKAMLRRVRIVHIDRRTFSPNGIIYSHKCKLCTSIVYKLCYNNYSRACLGIKKGHGLFFWGEVETMPVLLGQSRPEGGDRFILSGRGRFIVFSHKQGYNAILLMNIFCYYGLWLHRHEEH